jgi:hypothetical protein
MVDPCPGFERTDEAKAQESASLQRAKRDVRTNPPIPTRLFVLIASICLK